MSGVIGSWILQSYVTQRRAKSGAPAQTKGSLTALTKAMAKDEKRIDFKGRSTKVRTGHGCAIYFPGTLFCNRDLNTRGGSRGAPGVRPPNPTNLSLRAPEEPGAGLGPSSQQKSISGEVCGARSTRSRPQHLSSHSPEFSCCGRGVRLHREVFLLPSFRRVSSVFQDVLENDEIKLDWMFKQSLISDLCNVSIAERIQGLRSRG